MQYPKDIASYIDRFRSVELKFIFKFSIFSIVDSIVSIVLLTICSFLSEAKYADEILIYNTYNI